VGVAEAWAAQFAEVYLTFSPATQAQREQELAAFLPTGVAAANPDLGWNGTGQLTLQSEQVAGITVRDRQHAVVAVLATVNGQLMELGVPVIAVARGVVVEGGSDPVAPNEVIRELPAFIQAYANGDSAALSRFAARGAWLTGLGGAVTFDSIAGLHVPPGGATRQITVTVIWQLPSQVSSGLAEIVMTYHMSAVALQSGKWYVTEISASTEAVGAK